MKKCIFIQVSLQTKFSSQTAPQIVKVATCDWAGDENFVKMTIFDTVYS